MVKTVEKYTDLDRLRHSCSHVLAQAVKRKYPKAQLGFGPPVENGFYYDIALPEPLSEEDLRAIEEEMATIVKADYKFEKKNVASDEAKNIFKEKRIWFNFLYKQIMNLLPRLEKINISIDPIF